MTNWIHRFADNLINERHFGSIWLYICPVIRTNSKSQLLHNFIYFSIRMNDNSIDNTAVWRPNNKKTRWMNEVNRGADAMMNVTKLMWLENRAIWSWMFILTDWADNIKQKQVQWTMQRERMLHKLHGAQLVVYNHCP